MIATYGRALLALACGLFTGRWVLAALGTNRYGVFGVVGVILGLVAAVNSMLSTSVGRYFAYAVGQAQASDNSETAIGESCAWFNVALAIHIILASVLMLIGYPLGHWAITSYFEIPPEMVSSSLWVFSFSMVSAFFGMALVPFTSLYVSHQKIAELTVYQVASTVLNVVFAWILLGYPGDKLWFNGFYTMLIAITPNLIVACRAFCVFPECRVQFRRMTDWSRYRQLFSFTAWQLVGFVGLTFRFQGLPTLCNKVLGLQYNSSLAISGTLSQQTMTFSYAVNNAFSPAISNAAGAGDKKLFEALVIRSCKFGSLVCALIVLPVCVEVHYIVNAWLITVPPCVEALCVLTLAMYIVEQTVVGFNLALIAHGDIRFWQVCACLGWVASFFLGWYFLSVVHLGVTGILWALLICTTINSVVTVLIAWRKLRFQMGKWLLTFVAPYAVLLIASLSVGLFVRYSFEESFVRLLMVAFSMAVVAVAMGLGLVCDKDERQFVFSKLNKMVSVTNR